MAVSQRVLPGIGIAENIAACCFGWNPVWVLASPKQKCDQMDKFSLKCFGVGDGWPGGDRRHSSFLYRFGKTSLLIDCGETVSSGYKASGLHYDTIDRIFISHLHSDHIGGFFMLMQGFWLEQRQKELPVCMPAEGIKLFRQMLNSAFIFPELLQFRLRFEALRAGKRVTTGNVRVTPFPTTHLEQLRLAFQKRYPQDFAAYSFLIEAGRLRIGHSADIGAPEDLRPLLKKPLDLLVCELSHFQAEDLFLFLRGHAIKRIVFMHVGRPYWENLPKTRRLAEKMLGGIPFVFARDGQEFTL
jgi:ribonuclease BN (tRNA processing enzyme)